MSWIAFKPVYSILKKAAALWLIFTISACTNVKPWQKGILSKPEMAWTTDGLEASIEEHIFSSKEASHGGNGAAGGGCGCN